MQESSARNMQDGPELYLPLHLTYLFVCCLFVCFLSSQSTLPALGWENSAVASLQSAELTYLLTPLSHPVLLCKNFSWQKIPFFSGPSAAVSCGHPVFALPWSTELHPNTVCMLQICWGKAQRHRRWHQQGFFKGERPGYVANINEMRC